MGKVVVVSRVVVTLIALLAAYMVWRQGHMETMVDRVEADLVYYNRQPLLPSTVSRVPKTGSENLAFIIRHLAAKVRRGGKYR